MKIRPILLIIITLAIGFLLGMLTSAQIRYSKLKHVRVYFSEERFMEGFYRMIQPDEKQKVVIDDLLGKYAKQNSEIQGDFRRKMDSTMKEFWNELEPLLTREQLDRVREMEKRRMEMMRKNRRSPNDSTRFRNERGRQGPPFDGRPPYHGRPDSAGSKDNIEQVIK